MNDKPTDEATRLPVSLRDWFAGQALAGVLANQDLLLRVDNEFPELSTRRAAARYSYAVADAMLRARFKPQDSQP